MVVSASARVFFYCFRRFLVVVLGIFVFIFESLVVSVWKGIYFFVCDSFFVRCYTQCHC